MAETSICAKIAADILVNCTNPILGGTRDTAFIFNFDDIANATLTKNGVNPQIIEAIILGSGIVGYTVQGINNSMLPKNEMVKGKFLNSFRHEFNFKAFSLNPTIKAQLETLTKGKFVVIVENVYKGDSGEAAYEIYGLESGLICSVLQRDPSNPDTQGAYDITLMSSDQSRENHLPATFFKTSYAATKALIEAIVV